VFLIDFDRKIGVLMGKTGFLIGKWWFLSDFDRKNGGFCYRNRGF
jgi:hypothetical protein